jgi:tRNA nucleotidyltransferase/poly(A) polymerase
MIAPALLALFLAQIVDRHPRNLDGLAREMLVQELRTDRRTAENAEQRAAAFQEQRYAGTLNRFAAQLRDFIAQYNANRTVNVKNVKSLKQAWQELERVEPLLRPNRRE